MSSPVSTERTDTTDNREDSVPITIGEVSEIPTNSRRFYTINGVNITILNVDGELYAIQNSCPHKGGPIGEGKLLRTTAESTNPVSRFQDFDPRGRRGSQTLTPSIDTTARFTIGCPWHGWEFDLADGTPMFPAKRGVKTYEVQIEDGLIKLELPTGGNVTVPPCGETEGCTSK